MKNVLVPVDGSPAADRAVAHAIAMARRTGDIRIVLLNVQHTLPPLHRHGLLSDTVRSELRHSGEHEAGGARRLLDEAGILYDFTVVFGHPAEVILRACDEHGCEGIVMGTRGLGEMQHLMLGSTAYKVLQGAQVPVTLVK
jgi:nucleotide-binding universal stress UspA family protein